MANFTTATPTIDAALASSAANGTMQRLYHARYATGNTAATANSGGVSTLRVPTRIQMPSSNGTGVAGFIASNIWSISTNNNSMLVTGLEYEMGTLTVSGNTFTDGVAMPTKTVRGTSITTAASIAFAVVTTAVTATTPVLTITYTDQDGNTGQTATLTLPTSPIIHTGFYITPHLASGDTGIRDITNLSISTGTAGVIKIYGILPLSFNSTTVAPLPANLNFMSAPLVPYLIEPSEYIAVYRLGSTSSTEITFGFSLIPETT